MGILRHRIIEESTTECRRKNLKSLCISIFMLFQILLPAGNLAFAGSSKKIIGNVPIISQFPQLPTGCEAASTAMLLRWAGVNVTKEDIARTIPRGNIPVLRNGRLCGSNPNSVFVGNPFSRSGYGVYHGPIANIVNKYLPGQGLDITGTSFDNLLNIIDSGRPVIVWATINNAPSRVSKIWYDSSGSKIIWKIPEHAVVLVGYTDTHAIVNDPWVGKRVHYPISIFKNRWESMGSQAVTVKKN